MASDGKEGENNRHTAQPTACSCVRNGELSLLPSAGREMSSSLRATGRRPSVADWGGGMSASCKPTMHQVTLFWLTV